MDLEINIFTLKGFEQCVREETAHLATLILKVYKLLGTLLKENAKIETGMAEKFSWDQANRRQKQGLIWRNRKKISQIIKEYCYLPFFLLIILCPLPSNVVFGGRQGICV
jgi:hypothetical protein